ncbi:hypothetical protein CHH91_00030, partial [Virgibacillus sp. 7505]|uniref:hypothetical protein n=1 Tax=Virgibacillus sp. 7505 TaxID=2022548 RepID=UPI000BD2718D
MNVLFMTHSPKKGGAEQSMILLINSLSKEEDLNLYLLCPGDTEYIKEINKKVKIINLQLNSLRYKMGIDYISKVSKLYKIISDYDLDVLYANG